MGWVGTVYRWRYKMLHVQSGTECHIVLHSQPPRRNPSAAAILRHASGFRPYATLLRQETHRQLQIYGLAERQQNESITAWALRPAHSQVIVNMVLLVLGRIQPAAANLSSLFVIDAENARQRRKTVSLESCTNHPLARRCRIHAATASCLSRPATGRAPRLA